MMITVRIVFAVHRQPRTRFARRRIIPDQAGQQHVGRSCRILLTEGSQGSLTPVVLIAAASAEQHLLFQPPPQRQIVGL
jgi:hypothetical protein